jgi:bifunctional enzyme CysN/CysC
MHLLRLISQLHFHFLELDNQLGVLFLVSLIGIRRVVLAVNKMDLVDYAQAAFESIVSDYRAFAAQVGLSDITAIPISAAYGDNVVDPGANMPWYSGPTLMGHLESVDVASDLSGNDFRMPVQWVNRPHQDFRGFAGLVASGTVRPGDPIRVLPSAREAVVARIVTAGGDLPVARAGQSITLTLDREIDVSRGDVIASGEPPQVADQFEATIVWMDDEPMLPGRSYLLKSSTASVATTITPLKYKVNVNTLEKSAAERLELNDIGVCELELGRAIAFEPYTGNQALGSFILIDRLTNNTVGAGLLNFALRRSQNVHWQALDVGKSVRAARKGQKPCVLWLTGLSGAGKSTIANLVEKKLLAMDRHTYLLDGDNVRHGLNKDLGFTPQDRVENIRRVAEVAKLMVDAGLIVLVSFISPYRAERRMAREMLEGGEFHEVYVSTPLSLAEQRDPKGLYKKARRGELKNFTGIDSPYEPPENAEITLDTAELSAEAAAERIIEYLDRAGVLAQ